MTLQPSDKILRFSRCSTCDLCRPGEDPLIIWIQKIKNAKLTSGLENLGEIAKIEEGLLCNLCRGVTKRQIEIRWKI